MRPPVTSVVIGAPRPARRTVVIGLFDIIQSGLEREVRRRQIDCNPLRANSSRVAVPGSAETEMKRDEYPRRTRGAQERLSFHSQLGDFSFSPAPALSWTLADRPSVGVIGGDVRGGSQCPWRR